VHGSAPDIAGKDAANPLATLLSLAMMFRYSFDLGDSANLLEQAARTCRRRLRTGDIGRRRTEVSTTRMGGEILKELDNSRASRAPLASAGCAAPRRRRQYPTVARAAGVAVSSLALGCPHQCAEHMRSETGGPRVGLPRRRP
jgi:hypothetical protein